MLPCDPTAAADLRLARRLAVDAAEAAGRLLRGPAPRGTEMRVKDSGGDIVTDLDLAAEKIIIDRIRAVFPAHRIISEESGLLDAAMPGPGRGSGDGDPGRGWTWLVDPLDGTNNLAISLPAYVIGIALCAGDLPVIGVVHDPVAQQTWSAVRGCGAFGPQQPAATAGLPASPVRAGSRLDAGTRGGPRGRCGTGAEARA